MAVNAFERNSFRQRNKNANLKTKTEIGEVTISKRYFHEVAKSSIDSKGYWLKNEVAENINKYVSSFEYDGPEAIELSHNKKGTKTYNMKAKAKQMHVFKKRMFGYDFTYKVMEFYDGNLMAYTLYIQ